MPLNDRPETHPLLRDLRRLVDAYPGDRVLVGEVYLLDTAQVAPYYGDHDELHLAFNFPPLYTAWDAGRWREQIERTTSLLDPLGAWPTWVLSNHDNPRHRTRYGGREARARAAAVLLLGLRGTPFLYQGEELGLLDADDPRRAGRSTPAGATAAGRRIPWDPTAAATAGRPSPGCPSRPESDRRSVADQWADPASILHLYQRLLRRAAGLGGAAAGRPAPPRRPRRACSAWLRSAGADRRVRRWSTSPPSPSTSTARRVLGALAGWTVEVASDRLGEGARFTDRLGPDQAVVLRPG